MKLSENNKFMFIIMLLLGLMVASCEESAYEDRATFSPDGAPATVEEEPEEEEPEVVEEITFLRKNNHIFLEKVCACKDGKPISLSNGECTSFCNGNISNQEILHVTLRLADEVTLNDQFGDVRNWCGAEINENNTDNSCSLFYKDEDNNSGVLPIEEINSGAKKFKLNIAALQADKTYRLQLRQNGSAALSSTIQFMKVSEIVEPPALGPLYLKPVMQYACMAMFISQDEETGVTYWDDTYRMHFYTINEPDPVPEGISNIYCHDRFTYGAIDSMEYPRLNQTPGTFTLWSKTDPRFTDWNLDTFAEINNYIYDWVTDQGFTLSAVPNLFYPFEWTTAPPIGSEESENPNETLGYYMTPWLDTTTYKSYCPGNDEYNSSNNILRALKDYIGVETEALYIALRQTETFENQDGAMEPAPDDMIFINETNAKKIWFYLEDQVPIQPTDANIQGKKIYFYYPADYDSPFIKKSHQSVYVIKSYSDIDPEANQESNAGGDGARTSYPTHDKRIGCVPKGDDE